MQIPEYLSVNKKSWNKRLETHLQSEFYDLQGFKEGKSSLNDIELGFLENIEQKSILHLQCHFGQDSLSLARMGAKVTGIDLADKAIKTAQKLNKELNLSADFLCSDIYDLPNKLQGSFDWVFTSYGTIAWLPDLDKWAKVIQHFLKPQGKFLMVDFHPVVWMYDDDFKEVTYPYFKSEPIIENETGTYAAPRADLAHKTISWNHSLSEIFTSLLQNDLRITQFQEYDYSPYDCFKHTEKIGERKYQIQSFGNKIPMVYAIEALRL